MSVEFFSTFLVAVLRSEKKFSPIVAQVPTFYEIFSPFSSSFPPFCTTCTKLLSVRCTFHPFLLRFPPFFLRCFLLFFLRLISPPLESTTLLHAQRLRTSRNSAMVDENHQKYKNKNSLKPYSTTVCCVQHLTFWLKRTCYHLATEQQIHNSSSNTTLSVKLRL